MVLNEDLICDLCKSKNIVETKECFVCKNCGIVLEIQKMEYYKPYNYDTVQYAKLDKTYIGLKKERDFDEKPKERVPGF